MIRLRNFVPDTILAFSLVAIACLTQGCSREAARPSAPPASTAAASTASPDVPQFGGRIIRRLESDVSTLNPVLMTTSYERLVLECLFDGLVEINDKLEPVPGTARRWDVSPDGRTYTFYLDPAAKFSDGTLVTANDLLFSIRRYAADSSMLSGYLQGIKLDKTRAIDEKTVEVVFEHAKAGQIYAFSFPVLPEHVYGKGNFKNDFNDTVVGDGPYKLVRREPGVEIVLERRDDYAGAKPPVREIVFRIIPNATVAWSSLERGEIDEMRISTAQWEMYSADAAVRKQIDFIQFYELGYNFISWNNRYEPLSDPDVRRALTMGIDRAAIVEHIYHGGARVMSGPFTVEQWAFNPAVNPIPYDPVAARGILESKGWTDPDGDGILSKGKTPFRIELLVAAEDTTSVEQGQIYQDALRKLGIDVSLKRLEAASLFERVLSGKYQAVFLGYSLDLDPDLYSNFHSSQFVPEGQNWAFYKNAEVDDLLVRAREELDSAKRKEIYHKLHEILANDQPFSWLVQPSTRWAVARRVRNVRVAPGLGLFSWAPGPRAWWINGAGQEPQGGAGSAEQAR